MELSNDCLGNIISILDMSDRYHTGFLSMYWDKDFLLKNGWVSCLCFSSL